MNLDNTMLNQIFVLLAFVIYGVFIGIVFDLFRILRKTLKTNYFITCFQDIIFLIFFGISLIFMIFKYNSGEIRWYIFLGLFLGLLLYLKTLSVIFIDVSIKICSFIVKIVLFPIKKLIKLIKELIFRPISFIIINIRKKVTNFYNKFHKTRKDLRT